MLRQRIFQHNFYAVLLNSSRKYLSHELRSTANEGYISSFVNKIVSPAEKSKGDGTQDITKQFALLRSKKLEPAALDSAGFAVIHYFIQSSNSQDLVAVIANRLEYGVFLTHFSACYLLDYYLTSQDYAAAAHVAVEAVLQDLDDNELVVALALQACFAYLKAVPQSEIEVPKEEVSAKKKDEKKVRVKFIRNPVEFDMGCSKLNKKSLFQTFQRLSSRVQKEKPEIHAASEVITLLLSDKPANNVRELLLSKEYASDLLQLCKDMVKEKNADIEQALNEATTTDLSFQDVLDNYVKEKATKEQPKLLVGQQNDYKLWVQQHERDVEQESENKLRNERVANIDTIIDDIKTQRQKLWFFDDEEKLDLEIYNKRPKYIKRWFGKKKKPKVIDENYIPPEIRH